MNILLIASGGFIGAIVRYLVSKRLNPPIPKFPYGTLTVNLIGAFLLGWMIGHGISHFWMLLIGIGFCGSFTTFSTLQWEAVQLHKHKKNTVLFLYLGVTYMIGLVTTTIGFLIGKW